MNCANHPDRERIAFCQNCGKPLCAECARGVGNAVFCEPCLAARLAAADAAAAAAASSGTATGYSAVPNYGTPADYSTASAPVPPIPGAPNPLLAGLLGFIPGVGAMYNGQYAKGVVHLLIFAVLTSLSDHNGIFGLLVAGWVFYQVFDAFHTAKARRDGAPLPNPFSLNDVGERFGFGKAWAPGAATPPPPPTPPYTATGAPPQPGQYVADPNGNVFYQGQDGSQTFQSTDGSQFRQGQGFSQTYTPPPPPNYGYTIPPVPPTPPFADTAYPGGDPVAPANRFPTGAIWLIGLGLLFFFGSSGFFHYIRVGYVLPFLLIGFGVWVFIHKMTSSGLSLSNDGTPAYRLRAFRASRGAVWIILGGIMNLLDSFDILSWGNSWPLFIIVAGLMALLERAAYSSAVAAGYSYTGPYTTPPPAAAAPVAPVTSTSIVPTHTHDEEGR